MTCADSPSEANQGGRARADRKAEEATEVADDDGNLTPSQAVTGVACFCLSLPSSALITVLLTLIVSLYYHSTHHLHFALHHINTLNLSV